MKDLAKGDTGWLEWGHTWSGDFSMLTPTQYQCCSQEHLRVVVDLKRRYRNIRNELIKMSSVIVDMQHRFCTSQCQWSTFNQFDKVHQITEHFMTLHWLKTCVGVNVTTNRILAKIQ